MGLMDDKEIREAVFSEMEELIRKLETELMDYEKDLYNPEHIKKLFRYIHTIKGNAGMLECKPLISLSHEFENCLGLIRDSKIKIKKEFFLLFYKLHSFISKTLKKIKKHQEIETVPDNLINQIHQIIEKGEIEEELPLEKEDLIKFIKKDFLEAETVRVNLNKIDKLINLLGELHLTNRMYIRLFYKLKELILNQDIKNIETFLDEMEDKILKFNYIFDEFREDLLNVRMIHVSFLFHRFPKMIRELSASLNKKIEIKFEGENTDIDKRILEQAAEPLLHIVRNAIDHGIELPKDRIKEGKKETGEIIIKTYPEGGYIIIEISDDGKGMDINSIKEKLIQNKLASEKDLKLMTEKKIINAVFLPGFSTKEKVSELSGRGVGMDIVAQKIKNLKGEINITSEKNKGTTIKIILPMTLSIIEGFSIDISGNEFIFIKDDVKFLLELEPEQLNHIGNKTIFDYQKNIILVLELDKIFNLKIEKQTDINFLKIVVIQYKDNLYGFKVDKFNGIKSIVLKNTGTFIERLKLFEGATINEEGKVMLVINKAGIIEASSKEIYEKDTLIPR